MSQKGFIEYDDIVRPLSKKYIASKLEDLNSLKTNLSKLDRDELEFFIKDYYQEFNLDNKETLSSHSFFLDMIPLIDGDFFHMVIRLL